MKLLSLNSIQVSVFPNVQVTNPNETLSVEHVLKRIQSGYYRDPVGAVRNVRSVEEYNEAKRFLPAITWSGRFRRRKAAELEQHSGIICVDVDKVDPKVLPEMRSAIEQDPYTLACWNSPSVGALSQDTVGLKVLIRIEPERHLDSFRQIEWYYRELYCEIDQSCKDVSRLCFVSDDPTLFLNSDARQFELIPDEQPRSVQVLSTLTVTGTPRRDTRSQAESPYLRRAISEELRNLERAQEGGRNDALNKAAFALGQFVAGGELGESETYDALLATARVIGLPDAEADRTIRSGFAAAQQNPRTVPPDKPRPGRMANDDYPPGSPPTGDPSGGSPIGASSSGAGASSLQTRTPAHCAAHQENSDKDSGAAPTVTEPEARAERALVWAMIASIQLLDRIVPQLSPICFSDATCRFIVEAIVALVEQGTHVDTITVAAQLQKHGRWSDEVQGIIDSIPRILPDETAVDAHIELVRDAYLRRVGRELMSTYFDRFEDRREGAEDVLNGLEQALVEIRAETIPSNAHSLKELIASLPDDYEAAVATREAGGIVGRTTGLHDLNVITGGLQTGLYLLAARPGFGKTTLAGCIAKAGAKDTQGKRRGVLIFSIEMPEKQMRDRFVADHCGIESTRIRDGNLTEADWKTLYETLPGLTELPIYIDDSPSLSLLELRAKARRYIRELAREGVEIGLIVIDYLQLMHVLGIKSREAEISLISRGLKALTKELDLPIIALSQLNRAVDARKNKRPQLSDLRESGSLEQDSDSVLFIHNPMEYGDDTFEDGTSALNMVEIVVGKMRNGKKKLASGRDIRLVFDREHCRFLDPAHQEHLDFGGTPDGTAEDRGGARCETF